MVMKTLRSDDVGMPIHRFEIAQAPEVFALSSHARAKEALALGLERPGPQFNIYVLGPDQAGRMTATREYIENWAGAHPPAQDWLYLFDFDAPNTPRPIAVPAGLGHRFWEAIDHLIPTLAREIASAFASESYQQQISQLKASGDREIQSRSEALDARAEEKGLALIPTPQGPIVAARDENGAPVPLQTLPAERREQIMSEASGILEQLGEINRDALRRQREFVTAIEGLDKQVAAHATQGIVQAVGQQFAEVEALKAWTDRLAEDVVDHYSLFLLPNQPVPTAAPERANRRYGVNLIVDRRNDEHRPVVVEQNPTYENLFGKIEYRQLQGGGLDTDVSMIRAGSLHRSNGGVLILRATDMATQPGVWNFLKAALRDGEIRIEEFYRAGAPPIAGSPRPVPVALDLTVVLVGPASLYHMFFAADPDFSNYFKVKAHIESTIEATPENLSHFAGLLNRYAEGRGVTLTTDAFDFLLGRASRWAAHRERVTTRFEAVNDLIEEACGDCEVLDAESLRTAATARRKRNSQIEDDVHRTIRDGLTIIKVEGHAVGQINGLTVQNVGDHTFGAPARITARASVGRRGVINIERLVAMAGPIQQKASFVLQGLLTRSFARHAPTSFDCSVTFEQLYGGVEGDSASLAEYIAIISDLADLPIRQDLAITGSVNQLGEAQVIGGVHHKVEGFFRACRDLGELTGTQGVVLPARNEPNLILRDDVTEAIASGEFHLYSIEWVDEAVELFTGMPAGDPAEPSESTVYGRVIATLASFDALLADRGL